MTIQPTPNGAWQVIDGETVIAEYGNKEQALAHAISGQPMTIDEARRYLAARPEVVIENKLRTVISVVRGILPQLYEVQTLMMANPITFNQLNASTWSAQRWQEVLKAFGSAQGGGGITGWIQEPDPETGVSPLQVINRLD